VLFSHLENLEPLTNPTQRLRSEPTKILAISGDAHVSRSGSYDNSTPVIATPLGSSIKVPRRRADFYWAGLR